MRCWSALLVAALSAAAAPTAADAATLVHLSNQSAVCLDGTPAGYYFSQGDSKTFVFFLEGGGLCSNRQDCIERTKTDLGSSTGWGQSITLGGIQSADPQANPFFANATQVFIPYCSGDVHSGTRPASEETWGLHFTGHLIVRAVVAQLMAENGLEAAERVVFAGGSAGGMGVQYNIDYVASQLPSARVYGVPIGGYIFAHPNYAGPMAQNETETARLEDFHRDWELFNPFLDQSCRAALGEQDQWQCLVPTTLYQHISTELVIIESQTDSVVMFGFSDVPEQNISQVHVRMAALSDLTHSAISQVQRYVKQFRENSTRYAQAVSGKDSIFSPCCLMHTNFARNSPTIGGADYYNAIVQAVFYGKKDRIIDACPGTQCSANCPPFP